MKLKSLTLSVLFSLVAASPALAAARTDHSGILVWAFLGFCALIVMAQLVPAILVMLGIVKGATSPREQQATQKSQ